MSSNTKVFEDKMKSSVEHLSRELAAVRAGRANPAVLDKVVVDYYGAPTPIQQLAAVAVSEARTLTITPGDRTLLRPISKAIMASDVGITPIDDGVTIRLNFPAPNEERRKQLAAKAVAGEIRPEDINEQMMSDAMYTAGQKDPDFILRPSGEKRLSNFMLWQAAYSELVEMDVLWPDFTRADLDTAIEEFNHRSRRFGGI